jgi:hypothetical protein
MTLVGSVAPEAVSAIVAAAGVPLGGVREHYQLLGRLQC